MITVTPSPSQTGSGLRTKPSQIPKLKTSTRYVKFNLWKTGLENAFYDLELNYRQGLTPPFLIYMWIMTYVIEQCECEELKLFQSRENVITVVKWRKLVRWCCALDTSNIIATCKRPIQSYNIMWCVITLSSLIPKPCWLRNHCCGVGACKCACSSCKSEAKTTPADPPNPLHSPSVVQLSPSEELVVSEEGKFCISWIQLIKKL